MGQNYAKFRADAKKKLIRPGRLWRIRDYLGKKQASRFLFSAYSYLWLAPKLLRLNKIQTMFGFVFGLFVSLTLS